MTAAPATLTLRECDLCGRVMFAGLTPTPSPAPATTHYGPSGNVCGGRINVITYHRETEARP